jgi:hypothetical protein
VAVGPEAEQAGREVNTHIATVLKHAPATVGALFVSLLLPVTLTLGNAPANAMPLQDEVYQQRQSQGTPVAQKSDPKAPAALTIAESTAVVTAGSGYHMKLTVTNQSGAALPAGKLQVSANMHYGFVSRTDLQHWAEGETAIPVPNKLGEVDVPALAPNANTSVSVDVPADNPALATLLSWGPKPVLVKYVSAQTGSDPLAVVHTFMTRSGEGIPTANTPPMGITIAMPLTTDTWHVDTETVTKYLTSNNDEPKTAENARGTSDGSTESKSNAPASGASAAGKSGLTDLTQAALSPMAAQSSSGAGGKTGGENTPSGTAKTTFKRTDRLPKAVEQLIAKHSKLQVVTDPAYARNLKLPPQSSGIMQPGAFDITTYAASGNDTEYRDAGITPDSWSEASAQNQWRQALGDPEQKAATYAWQGDTKWTLSALTAARSQGYGTVIAQGEMDDGDTDAAQTAKHVIPTTAGDITLLASQTVLTELAQGHSTTKASEGEASDAGRLARFMAQSAFYQMEQPYTDRNVLVCLGTSADTTAGASNADALMRAVEQAPWLRQSDLKTLTDSQPSDRSGERVQRLLPASGGLNSQSRTRLERNLAKLTTSRNDVTRFESSILAKPSADDRKNTSHDAASADNASADYAKDADAANDSGDVQSLARQDASDTAKRSKNGSGWIREILALHDAISLNATSIGANDNSLAAEYADGAKTDGGGTTGSASDGTTADMLANPLGERMAANAAFVTAQLMNGVSITPSEPITIVSESATMPVTIRNNHPYPVQVKVSSITDSMEIATSRFQDITVPAKSEAQTTFTVRASTSGATDAHLTLTDRNKSAFSTPQTTHISCAMRLSDKSGLAFIGVSLFLGVLGLWRQFHVKKDADQ